jgi:predicted acetyltransferase
MSLITPNQSLITSSVKDLVVVLTGGAQGVGRNVAEQLYCTYARPLFVN